MQTEQIRSPSSSFVGKASAIGTIGGSHYQVPRRRRSSVSTAPYQIPSKVPGMSKIAGSSADGINVKETVSGTQDKQQTIRVPQLPSSTSTSLSNYSIPRTGGPIHTHHYPSEQEQDRLRLQQLQEQQQQLELQLQQEQLQEQVKLQMERSREMLQIQHRNSKQLQRNVPMLSREFVVRRISEGESGRLKEELKCEACGKGYKHITSLAKHLWEHTPEWQRTKKLSISKHQQVQLLEAASILCSMNEKKKADEMAAATHRRSVSPTQQLNGYADNSGYQLSTARKNSMSRYPPSSLSGSLPAYLGRKASISTGSSLREVRRDNGLNKDNSEVISSDLDDDAEEAEGEEEVEEDDATAAGDTADKDSGRSFAPQREDEVVGRME
ncbi:DEKNAAC100576 [Brettanomyces naardenensis]|uniref:DEKNAAC100576 n=1 Tax=Brettanomyces naardenensis TaxID=13370 RepID=A0A448YFB7_BRENA|nr:DEKNAAC100576 [Brettanomyces naardenensis]